MDIQKRENAKKGFQSGGSGGYGGGYGGGYSSGSMGGQMSSGGFKSSHGDAIQSNYNSNTGGYGEQDRYGRYGEDMKLGKSSA